MTAQTNVFGTINICNALFPLLRDHARVFFNVRLLRVVNVASQFGISESVKNS
jgi:hypothetical protein